VTFKILVKLASRIKSLEKELANSNRRLIRATSRHSSPSAGSPESTGRVEASADDTDEEIKDLSAAIARFTLRIPKQVHFGESSNVMMVMAAMEQRNKVPDDFKLWREIFSRVRRQPFWENPSVRIIFQCPSNS
jgi:hypothetical protein